MQNPKLLFVIFLSIIAAAASGSNDILFSEQDTLRESQVLYNGRVWRNLYATVVNDQFIFTGDFIPGSVSMGGRIFKDVPLKYDLYNDELITQTRNGLLIQLNKEMVDSFSLSFNGSDYLFVHSDTVDEFSGYFNLLYKGKSTFIVKYRKKIELLAVDRQFDRFYLTRRMFLVRENSIDPFSGRLEFLRLLSDKKNEVKDFMRKNRITLSKKNPGSFVPVIRYYDSLK